MDIIIILKKKNIYMTIDANMRPTNLSVTESSFASSRDKFGKLYWWDRLK